MNNNAEYFDDEETEDEYDEFEEDVLSVWDDYLDDDYNDDYDDYYDDSKSLCRGCPFIGDCRTCYED